MKKLLVVGIILLFVGASVIPSTIGTTEKKTTFNEVRSPGYIQDLIDNASDGDTIYIPSGVYYDNIIINKSISLIGEDKNITIIDGGGIGNVIYVTADWVNISGFTIQNCSDFYFLYHGVHILSNHTTIMDNIISYNDGNGICTTGYFNVYCHNNTIINNYILNNLGGISITTYSYWGAPSNDNTIKGNIIVSNNYYGISLDSKNNTITGNYISKNQQGITVCGSNNIIKGNNILSNNYEGIRLCAPGVNNIITGNNVSNNKYGISLDFTSKQNVTSNILSNNRWGISIINSDNNIITYNLFFNCGLDVHNSNNYVEDNLVNYKPLVYLEDESDRIITDAGQIILINCDNIIVNNLNLSNTAVGIVLMNTNNCLIQNNKCSNNQDYGIELRSSSNNTIINNIIFSNNEDGCIYRYSNNNTIIGNNIISNNGNGISFRDSNNNTVTENNITSNNGNGIYYYSSYLGNNIFIGNKIISNNKSGICLSADSKKNIIKDNIISSNNGNGICLNAIHGRCIDNIIKGNNIISNNESGIYLCSNYINSCNNNTIIGNNISDNYYGIKLGENSDYNIIYHNNFINNDVSAYDECNNIWDDGEYGNYWSDYEEKYPDAKKKRWTGIWDTPYEIEDGDNKDNFPLINQYPKSVIKTKSIAKPFNYNFPILNWLLERFSYTYLLIKHLLKFVPIYR